MAGFTLNTVAVSGNLTRDPELRATGSGTSVCSLRIAFNERYKDATGEWTDRANYINLTIWGGLGEWVAQNLSKGDSIAVQGRLRWNEWQDQNGNNRQDISITVDAIMPRNGGGGGGGGAREQRQREQAEFTPRQESGFAPRGDVPFDAPQQPAQQHQPGPDDDIPF